MWWRLALSGRQTGADVAARADEVAALGDRIGRHFARSESRDRAVGYVRGLLSDTERKNGWHVVEYLGAPAPDGVEHLLAGADWDADAALVEPLAHAATEPAAGVLQELAHVAGQRLHPSDDRPDCLQPGEWTARV